MTLLMAVVRRLSAAVSRVGDASFEDRRSSRTPGSSSGRERFLQMIHGCDPQGKGA